MKLYHFEQNDPEKNWNFSRRWNEPEHLNTPSALDRRADWFLGLGRVADAERLSHRAEALRVGVAQ